jgi:hypothetical protein
MTTANQQPEQTGVKDICDDTSVGKPDTIDPSLVEKLEKIEEEPKIDFSDLQIKETLDTIELYLGGEVTTEQMEHFMKIKFRNYAAVMVIAVLGNLINKKILEFEVKEQKFTKAAMMCTRIREFVQKVARAANKEIRNG